MGYLVGSIDSKDVNVLSALAEICQDDTGMRENFELDATFLAPTCPVANKKCNNKVAFDITTSVNNGKKYGRDKTGVEQRYHKKHEFLFLPHQQFHT